MNSEGKQRAEESVLSRKMRKVVCKNCFENLGVPERRVEILNSRVG